MHGTSPPKGPPHPNASRELWALYHAALGFPVLPLHSVVNGQCSCADPDCRSPAKHPRTPHGVKDASRDPKQIRAWFEKWPEANVGIATGSESGLIVIDIDPRNGGEVSFAQLRKELPDAFVDLMEVRTGSGGRHLQFQCSDPLPSRANILPGIDVKGDGGYVVAPSSIHASGQRYRYVPGNGPAPPPLQLALRELILSKAQAHRADAASLKVTLDTLRVSDTIKQLIREGKPAGQRSEAIFASIRAMVKAGHSDDEIRAVLLDPDNKLSDKPREKGVAWLDGEISRARQKGDSVGCSAGLTTAVRPGPDQTPEVWCLADVEREEVQWLWLPYIPIGKLTIIEGDPGVGKSWLTTAIAAAVSKAAHLPGDEPPRKSRRVLVLTAEDGLSDTLRP